MSVSYASISSDNGLSPGRCRVEPLSDHTFSFKKMHLKTSANWLPCCLNLNVVVDVIPNETGHQILQNWPTECSRFSTGRVTYNDTQSKDGERALMCSCFITLIKTPATNIHNDIQNVSSITSLKFGGEMLINWFKKLDNQDIQNVSEYKYG